MTKILSLVCHKNNNLNANEGFVIMFLNSKLITCFVDNFTLKRKSQSIAYLLNESEHIHWILDLENEVHSIRVIWTNGLQECMFNVNLHVTWTLCCDYTKYLVFVQIYCYYYRTLLNTNFQLFDNQC